MFIELVDRLRCARPHDLTWLVALSERLEHRDIIAGELGCPTCGARYRIARSIADFTLSGADSDTGAPVPEVDSAAAAAARRELWSEPPEELAVRAAALLDLATPGGAAVLAGAWSVSAELISVMLDGIALLAIDPPNDLLPTGAALSVLRAGSVLPLRPASFRGIALDAAHATPANLATAAGALGAGGRLVAPASVPLPRGVRELARDERHWVAVAEEGAGAEMVPLARAARRTSP